MKPDIRAIEERAERATKGPCAVLSSVAEGGDPSDTWFIKAQPHPAMRGFTKDIAMVEGRADAEFIGAAYRDIPALLTYIKELEGQVEKKDAALLEISTPKDGTELWDQATAAPEADRMQVMERYWFNRALEMRQIARAVLTGDNQ